MEGVAGFAQPYYSGTALGCGRMEKRLWRGMMLCGCCLLFRMIQHEKE